MPGQRDRKGSCVPVPTHTFPFASRSDWAVGSERSAAVAGGPGALSGWACGPDRDRGNCPVPDGRVPDRRTGSRIPGRFSAVTTRTVCVTGGLVRPHVGLGPPSLTLRAFRVRGRVCTRWVRGRVCTRCALCPRGPVRTGGALPRGVTERAARPRDLGAACLPRPRCGRGRPGQPCPSSSLTGLCPCCAACAGRRRLRGVTGRLPGRDSPSWGPGVCLGVRSEPRPGLPGSLLAPCALPPRTWGGLGLRGELYNFQQKK